MYCAKNLDNNKNFLTNVCANQKAFDMNQMTLSNVDPTHPSRVHVYLTYCRTLAASTLIQLFAEM
jgi:hypothetical protein